MHGHLQCAFIWVTVLTRAMRGVVVTPGEVELHQVIWDLSASKKCGDMMMKMIAWTLLSGIVVALPVSFLSITIGGSGSYISAFGQPGVRVIVAEGIAWYAACGFLSTLLAMRFDAKPAASKYRGLVHILTASVTVSVPLAYTSTTLYQSIAAGAFTSVGTYPQSWIFYLRALRWYLLCAILTAALAKLLLARTGAHVKH